MLLLLWTDGTFLSLMPSMLWNGVGSTRYCQHNSPLPSFVLLRGNVIDTVRMKTLSVAWLHNVLQVTRKRLVSIIWNYNMIRIIKK